MKMFFRSSYWTFLALAFAASLLMAWHILRFMTDANGLNAGADFMLAGIAGFMACLAMLGAFIAEEQVNAR